MLNQDQIETAERMWRENYKTQEICNAIGITPRKFESYRPTCLKNLEKRQHGSNGGKWARRASDPSMETIAKRAAEIRSKWTHEVEMQRRFGAKSTLVEFDISPQEKRAPTLPDITE